MSHLKILRINRAPSWLHLQIKYYTDIVHRDVLKVKHSISGEGQILMLVKLSGNYEHFLPIHLS